MTTAHGRYADDTRPPFLLPNDWRAPEPEVLETALPQTLKALSGPGAGQRLRRYYDPASDYAGTSFLDVSPNHPDEVHAADLWAVSLLSIEPHARQSRLLLDAGSRRTEVHRLLRAIDVDQPITDLEHAQLGSALLLSTMYELQRTLRGLLSTDLSTSKRWVFAAKLCARKRPLLFPVRDKLVSEYLGQRKLQRDDGWPGDFGIDIQVHAYLQTHPKVRGALADLRAELEGDGIRVDESDLRLLDSALWTKAKWGDKHFR